MADTSILMKLDHQENSYQSVDLCIIHISTPLKIEVWEKCLCNHPDKDFVAFILKGIKQGFRIGVDLKYNYKFQPPRTCVPQL